MSDSDSDGDYESKKPAKKKKNIGGPGVKKPKPKRRIVEQGYVNPKARAAGNEIMSVAQSLRRQQPGRYGPEVKGGWIRAMKKSGEIYREAHGTEKVVRAKRSAPSVGDAKRVSKALFRLGKVYGDEKLIKARSAVRAFIKSHA